MPQLRAPVAGNERMREVRKSVRGKERRDEHRTRIEARQEIGLLVEACPLCMPFVVWTGTACGRPVTGVDPALE